MRRDVFVYMAGPIAPSIQKSLEDHVAAAIGYFLELVKAGIPAFCPHATAIFPSCQSVSYDAWMAYDDAVLTRCTHVLMLPGWGNSKGARIEEARARELNIPIAYSIQELFQQLGM